MRFLGLMFVMVACASGLGASKGLKVRGGGFTSDWNAREAGQLFGLEEPEKAVVDAEKALAGAFLRRFKALFMRGGDDANNAKS